MLSKASSFAANWANTQPYRVVSPNASTARMAQTPSVPVCYEKRQDDVVSNHGNLGEALTHWGRDKMAAILQMIFFQMHFLE